MKILKNIVNISISASILMSSIRSHAIIETCETPFKKNETLVSTSIQKSLTVREHLKELGLLKTDKEVSQLKIEDKEFYLSMLDLDYSKAQEITRFFSTFNILTSKDVIKMFSETRKKSNSPLAQYLKDSRIKERKEISSQIAALIVENLGVSHSHDNRFILNEDFETLDSSYKVRQYRHQESVVHSFGIPSTMTKEIAQFFESFGPSSREFEFLKILILKNFNLIAYAAEPKDSRFIQSLFMMQGVFFTALKTGGTFLGMNHFVDEPIISGVFAGLEFFIGGGLSIYFYDNLSDKIRDKIVIGRIIERRLEKSAKAKSAKQIQSELLMLSGLDPQSIQALPTVKQLEKKPPTQLVLTDLLARKDYNQLAYPSVDLSKLENALESQISIIEIEALEPNFDEINEIAENPFALLSYGIELTHAQNLVIGRETVLGQKFKEITERMSIWQNKRAIAKTEVDNAWVINEKTSLTKLLSENAKENSSSWKYLAALKKAIQRFDNYLIAEIKPHSGDAKRQVENAHENYLIVLDQIQTQIESLKDRAEMIESLMLAVKR